TLYAVVDDETGSATVASKHLTLEADGSFSVGGALDNDELATLNGAALTGISHGDLHEFVADGGYAVKGADDGAYYTLSTNPATGELTWDSATAALDATANVDVANGPVSS